MERIKWIDTARGICIFCVLLAHVGQNHHYLHMMYSPWFLALFFFVSGYLYRCTVFMDDIKRLTRSLIVPYYLLSFILFIIGLDNWGAAFEHNWSFLKNKIYDILMGRHLWFIPCIIMVQFYFIVLSHVFMRSVVSKIIMFIIFLLSIYWIRNDNNYVAPYCCDIACFACSYFILGNIVSQKKEYVNRFIKQGVCGFFCNSIYGTLILLLCYFVVVWGMNYYFDMEFHFAYNYYANPVCFLILSLMGIGVICVLSKYIKINAFDGLGRNSLVAFVFNGKAYAICSLFFSSASKYNPYVYSIVICAIESIILLLFAWAINKFCPVLIGRSK